MIRNKQYQRFGVARKLLPWLCSRSKSTVDDKVDRQLARRRSTNNMKPISTNFLRLRADHGLIAMGVSAAICSAAFATFMIIQDGHMVKPGKVEYPDVYSRAFYARPHQPKARANNPVKRSIDYRSIDYNVTGSISINDGKKTSQKTAPLSKFDRIASSAGLVSNNTYVLRFVHGESALLQNGQAFFVAKLGMMIPSFGKVLSIGKIGDRWMLVTDTRIFTEEKNNLP